MENSDIVSVRLFDRINRVRGLQLKLLFYDFDETLHPLIPYVNNATVPSLAKARFMAKIIQMPSLKLWVLYLLLGRGGMKIQFSFTAVSILTSKCTFCIQFPFIVSFFSLTPKVQEFFWGKNVRFWAEHELDSLSCYMSQNLLDGVSKF